MSAATDDELLVRARNKDVPAFEELVARSRDRVFGVALRILHSDAEAAEVAQETFLAAWKSLHQLTGEFSHWVHRIAANRALMRLRHQKVANEVEESIESPQFNARGSLIESVADWSRNAEGQSLDAELRGAIEKASDALPEAAKQVFMLHDVEGLDYEQISEITGDSVAALKSRLHRARLQMRGAIDAFYAERQQ